MTATGAWPGDCAIGGVEQAAEDGAVEAFDQKEVAGDGDAGIAAGVVVADHRGEIAEGGELAEASVCGRGGEVLVVGDRSGRL